MFGSLELEIWILPFDSFDHEALDRLAQGGEFFDFAQDREPVERLVEPFVICCLEFFYFKDTSKITYPIRLIKHICGTQH
jgi:hypothetical protein